MKFDERGIKKLFPRIEHVGSTFTCYPAPVGTDIDWLAYSEKDPLSFEVFKQLTDAGWFYEGNIMYSNNDIPSEFSSFRRGDHNLIVTNSSIFFDRFMLATGLAKRFNLLDKDDRVALFQAILYGSKYNIYTIREVFEKNQ